MGLRSGIVSGVPEECGTVQLIHCGSVGLTLTMRVQVYAGFCAVLLSLLVLRPTASATTDVTPLQPEESEVYCDTCVKFDNVCYNRSYMFELTAPFRKHVVIKKMGILRDNNVLYYSFEPIIKDPEFFKVAYVSLDAPETDGVINGKQTFNFSVFDINQNENSIYLGGSDCIWVLRGAITDARTLSFFISKGDSITSVVSKDYVYFSKEVSPGIFKNKNGVFDILLEERMIKDFVLDKDVEYTIVYLNATGLHAFNSKTKDEVWLSRNPFFRGLTVDLDAVVYAWYVDGIYKVTLDSVMKHSKLTRVSDIVVGAMTFDNGNNIIYSNEKSLYKLTKTDLPKC